MNRKILRFALIPSFVAHCHAELPSLSENGMAGTSSTTA
jgi:hypothetical protein